MKRCPRCGILKAAGEFYHHDKAGRPRGKCKPCSNEYEAERIKKDPEQFRRTQRRSVLKQRYGLSEERFNALLASQGGACAICGAPPDPVSGLSVDKASDGRVRGLLCVKCRSGLRFLKDDPRLVRAAAEYVRNGGVVQE